MYNVWIIDFIPAIAPAGVGHGTVLKFKVVAQEFALAVDACERNWKGCKIIGATRGEHVQAVVTQS